MPSVELLYHTPLEIAVIAARVCKDSFDKSDTVAVQNIDTSLLDVTGDSLGDMAQRGYGAACIGAENSYKMQSTEEGCMFQRSSKSENTVSC